MPMKARYTVIDGEVIAEKRNGVRKQYVPDPLGSTVALLDSSQTQTDTFSYWPYGEEASRTGTTDTLFQYVGTMGYYRDTATRNYVRARYLDVQSGRFLSQVRFGELIGGEHPYGYAYNNPISYTDPSGLAPVKPGIGKGQCPGADAVDLIKELIHTHPNCMKDFQKLCNGQSLQQVLSQITFTVQATCSPNDPSVACMTKKWFQKCLSKMRQHAIRTNARNVVSSRSRLISSLR